MVYTCESLTGIVFIVHRGRSGPHHQGASVYRYALVATMSAREVPRSEELSSALDAARTRVESTSQVMSPYTARMAESTATSTVPVVDEQLAKKVRRPCDPSACVRFASDPTLRPSPSPGAAASKGWEPCPGAQLRRTRAGAG